MSLSQNEPFRPQVSRDGIDWVPAKDAENWRQKAVEENRLWHEAQREIARLRDALRLAEWGTEGLCPACWNTDDGEAGYGVDPVHVPGCPIEIALGGVATSRDRPAGDSPA